MLSAVAAFPSGPPSSTVTRPVSKLPRAPATTKPGVSALNVDTSAQFAPAPGGPAAHGTTKLTGRLNGPGAGPVPAFGGGGTGAGHAGPAAPLQWSVSCSGKLAATDPVYAPNVPLGQTAGLLPTIAAVQRTSLIATVILMSAPGGPGGHPPGGAQTCINVLPMKFAGNPLGESGVPAVRYGDFCTGGWHEPYAFGALCTALGAGQDLYEITSESRFGVAPFGRTCVPSAPSTQMRPANDTSSKSTGTLTSAVL